MATRKAIRAICLWGIVPLTLAGCGPKLPEGCPPRCAGAILSEANLRGADLSEANLYRADLELANLSEANLAGVNVCDANLSGANLAEADLSGVNLEGATVTEEQLAPAKSLKGARMPDGTKHE